jgi:cation:H+ antiporter
MIAVSTLSANLLAIIFLACAGIIAFAGTKMAKTAEEIAVQTGLGQAIVGAIFVGVSTSLSGTILSFYTAFENHPSLSVSNSIGGIAAQTAFLALADLTYRRANLEHAAASLENLAQGALLIILLSIPLLATVLPEWTAFSIHPFSPLLFLVYLAGVRIVRTIRSDPMWSPKKTAEMQTEPDKAFPDPKKLHGLLTKFSILVLILVPRFI